MEGHSVTTGPAPEVEIEEIFGNLQVKGWDQPEVFLKSSDGESASLEQRDGVVHIRARGDCLLRLPADAMVTAKGVHGWARFRMLSGSLRIGRVLGSVQLDGIGDAQIESIFGELLARSVAGDLKVSQVLGNAKVDQLGGKCLLDRVAGNFDLRDAEDEIVLTAGSNARLRLESLTGTEYRVTAGGNIEFRVGEEINARVSLSSREGHITVILPAGKSVLAEKTHEFTLGQPGAVIDLAAGGSITFSCQESWAGIRDETEEPFGGVAGEYSQKIADEMEMQLESQFRTLDEQLANLAQTVTRAGISPQEAERIMQRAREASEQASARAQEKMRRAREKIDRKMAEAQRKAAQRDEAAERRHGALHSSFRGGWEPRRWHFEWRSQPQTEQAPVTDEERLTILRMLEQKKITVEEAERLLAALEGKND